MSERDLKTLKMALRKFAADCDWDKFHSPKNLAMALIGETAEIVEHFQWLNEAESKRLNATKKREIQEELGDALIYLVRLADKLEICAFADKLSRFKTSNFQASVKGM